MVKDVHNASLRHIRLTEQDKKPVTNSRDTQEVEPGQGMLVLNIFREYRGSTTLLDDFDFYGQRQGRTVPCATVPCVTIPCVTVPS